MNSFEYEDEIIDTSISEIDTQVQDEGYITTLNLVGAARTATVSAAINGSVFSGYVKKVFLNNDGSGYTSPPTITFSASPTGVGGDRATAVGIITTVGGVTSLQDILITNAGAGYTVAPTISITGGGGTGAAATCSVITSGNGVIRFVVTDGGVGYGTEPTITVSAPPASGISSTAVGIASLGINAQGRNEVKTVYVGDPGGGYSSTPTVTVSDPEYISIGIGTTTAVQFQFNEIIMGETSKTEARVKEWDADTLVLKIANVSIGSTQFGFYPGENLYVEKILEQGILYKVIQKTIHTINTLRTMSLKLKVTIF